MIAISLESAAATPLRCDCRGAPPTVLPGVAAIAQPLGCACGGSASPLECRIAAADAPLSLVHIATTGTE
jgi:hypothetical protein